MDIVKVYSDELREFADFVKIFIVKECGVKENHILPDSKLEYELGMNIMDIFELFSAAAYEFDIESPIKNPLAVSKMGIVTFDDAVQMIARVYNKTHRMG